MARRSCRLRAKRGAFQAEKPGSVKLQRFRGVKGPALFGSFRPTDEPRCNRHACGNSSPPGAFADDAYARAGVYDRVGEFRSGVQHWCRRHPAGAGKDPPVVGVIAGRHWCRSGGPVPSRLAQRLLRQYHRLHDPAAGRDHRLTGRGPAGGADSHSRLPVRRLAIGRSRCRRGRDGGSAGDRRNRQLHRRRPVRHSRRIGAP